MDAKEYIKMTEEVEKLRDRGIEIDCQVDNGIVKITAGRMQQEKAIFPEIPSVRYI